MIIDLDEAEKLLLLKTLAIAFQIEFLKGKDNSNLEVLIQKMADSLKEEGNMHIFKKVFTKFKHDN